MIRAYCKTANISIITAIIDNWGEETFTTTSIKAYVKNKLVQVRNEGGQEVTSTAQVYLPPTVAADTLNATSKIIINSIEYGVLAIEDKVTFGSKYFRLVYLGAGTANA